MKLKKHKKGSRKGDNGRVLIIGGSKDYAGALALAGIAALRSGCDWVTVAAPEKSAWAVNCLSADLVTKKFSGEYFSSKHVKAVVKLAENFDVVLIGNGIGLKSKGFVKSVIKKLSKIKLVIDADALKVVRLQDLKNCVLTPHKKEFEILLKNSGVKELKKVLGNNVVLLKGPVDKIISRTKTKLNKTGNEGMSKAGTGDVLAGLTAGFISQGYSLFDSAYYAAYFNGKTGDMLKKKKGYSFLASDLAEDVKKVIKKGK